MQGVRSIDPIGRIPVDGAVKAWSPGLRAVTRGGSLPVRAPSRRRQGSQAPGGFGDASRPGPHFSSSNMEGRMAKTPKKAAAKKPGAKKTAEKAPAAEAPKAMASPPKLYNTPMDEENRKLFLNTHLPSIKALRDKLNTANANLRNAYKTAKAEGNFTKADFDTAIAIEDEEKEAKAKARIARQLVIARYMGKSLGAQLELFLAPDMTPSSDIAFSEGEQDAVENKPAKPTYHPSTEQHRRYMEGYHSVSEKRVKEGIKPLHPEVASDQEAKAEKEAKTKAQKDKDAEVFDNTSGAAAEPPPALKETTSGIPTSRAQFIAQQAAKAGNGEDSAFSRKN